jgi:hypothetical protein
LTALAKRSAFERFSTPHHRKRRTLPRRHSIAAGLAAVVGDRPIGEYHSVESVSIPQQTREQLSIESRPDLLERTSIHRRALEYRVRRHHTADVRCKRAQKWLHVIVESARLELGESAVAVVAVEAALLRAVADPVLHHCEHADRIDAVRAVLESFDVRAHQLLREVGVLAECPVDSAPAGLGREISLWRQRLLDSHGAILLPRDIRKAPDERRVTNRGEAECLGPLREFARLGAGAEGVLEVVSGIGADRERYAEPRALRDFLELVVFSRER